VDRLKATIRLLAHLQPFVIVLTGSSVTRSRLEASNYYHLQIERCALLPSEAQLAFFKPDLAQTKLDWTL
jgi:hypothetical protein